EPSLRSRAGCAPPRGAPFPRLRAWPALPPRVLPSPRLRAARAPPRAALFPLPHAGPFQRLLFRLAPRFFLRLAPGLLFSFAPRPGFRLGLLARFGLAPRELLGLLAVL